MTSFDWYSVVDPGTPLTQGDFIDNCPVLVWKSDATEDLRKSVNAERVDCIVMSQACDLEQNRVERVILCPNYRDNDYREQWTQALEADGKSTSNASWRGYLKQINAAKMWHLALLDKLEGTLTTEMRIVDFSEIFSLPREFLEFWLRRQNEPRLTLLPPYREHLSQAFARYFMRVGLPNDIEIPS